MTAMLIRNLDDSVRASLRTRAKRHGRSLEAEVRDILTREAKAEMTVDWDLVATVATGQTGPVTRELINQSYDESNG